MTRTDDLSELKRLAEAAAARPDAADNDRLAIRPSTILSLIARVEKAEELVIDRGAQITELAGRIGAAEARVKELESKEANRSQEIRHDP